MFLLRIVAVSASARVCHNRRREDARAHATLGALFARPTSMRCTLVVQGLLDWPSSALAGVARAAPALSRLLESDASPTREPDALVATACRVCGLAKQQDWPVAPWLARAAGIAVGDAYWLCADPAQFVVGPSDVRLGGLVGDLDAGDAQVLVAMLNGHFAGDGIRFFAPTPAHWFASAHPPPRMVTRPPEVALGAPMIPYLAAGPDAARWRRWQNELQMLFFEHAVNRRREGDGHVGVDSLWLWGGGRLVPPAAEAARIFADGGLVCTLGRSIGLDCLPLPAAFSALPPAAPCVIWLESKGGDDPEELARIERAWMAPFERALHAGLFNTLELILTGRTLALAFRVLRPSRGKRWLARIASQRASSPLARLLADGSN